MQVGLELARCKQVSYQIPNKQILNPKKIKKDAIIREFNPKRLN
jgi:hypothetical protein